MIIRERGLPFDPNQLPRYNAEADIDSRASRGMGIFLMKEMMDEVTFTNLGAGGKETCFVKHFQTPVPGEHEEAMLAPDLPAPAPGQPKREAVSYTVRLMEPSEAIEISKCAYRSHGYTFFTDHIYYPEKIVEMNRDGHMVSAVAVTETGKFMGHAALVYPFPGSRIAELTYIFVNIEYRGQGCMDRLCNFLYTVPKPSPLNGIYTYSVTNHVFTQRVMAKMDIRDCGILVATSPVSWQFRGIDGDATQRISVALSYRYLTEPKTLDLYPPQAHLDIVRALYRNLSAEHRFPGPAGNLPCLPDGPSEIETEVFGPEGCAEVRIIRSGKGGRPRGAADPARSVPEADLGRPALPPAGGPEHLLPRPRIRDDGVLLRRDHARGDGRRRADPPVPEQRPLRLRQSPGLHAGGQTDPGVYPRLRPERGDIEPSPLGV